MNLCIYKLESRPCKAYLDEYLAGWGKITDSVVTNKPLLDTGSFYSIAPKGMNDLSLLYKFSLGWVVFPPPLPEDYIFQGGYKMVRVENNARRAALNLINWFLQHRNNYLILEDNSATPDFEYVKSRQIKFCLYKGVMVYILGSDERMEVETYYNYVNGYGFFPILSSLDGLENENDKCSKIEPLMSEIAYFHTPIYDGESYLIWISNERPDILDELNGFINCSTFDT